MIIQREKITIDTKTVSRKARVVLVGQKIIAPSEFIETVKSKINSKDDLYTMLNFKSGRAWRVKQSSGLKVVI